jgi:hypothetical protein
MNAQSFHLTAETLEARDAPVILLAVIPLLPVDSVGPIDFVNYAQPQHSGEVLINSRGALVSLVLSPADPGDPR